MINIPTTYGTILGGAGTENEWGDPIEGSEELHTRVPTALHVQPIRSTSDEGQREPVVIEFWTAYVPNHLDVTDAQRFRDERTGLVYLIDHVIRPPHAGMPQDTRLDLRRVS
jgi:hypothetical protein